MSKDKLEQVEQVLDKIRDSFLFPRPELNNTLEKGTRNLLDVSYSLLYQVKEQQSEIKKLKEDLAKKDLTDDDYVVIWVDNKYYLSMTLLTTNVSLALNKPELTFIGAYLYKEVKDIFYTEYTYSSLKLLDNHEVVIVPAKDFNGKFNTNYNFMELGITNED
jgi:hypothetical protein